MQLLAPFSDVRGYTDTEKEYFIKLFQEVAPNETLYTSGWGNQGLDWGVWFKWFNPLLQEACIFKATPDSWYGLIEDTGKRIFEGHSRIKNAVSLFYDYKRSEEEKSLHSLTIQVQKSTMSLC